MTAHGSLLSTLDLRAAGGRAYLVEIREPDRAPRRFTVDDLTEVGRRADPPAGMVTVEHRSVSRRHARFQVLGGQLTVTDLGSMNGTRVNGVRVGGTTRLALGDRVELAAVTLTVVATQAAHRSTGGDRGGEGAGPTYRTSPAGTPHTMLWPVLRPAQAPPPAPEPAAPQPAEPQPTKAEPRRPFPNYLQLPHLVPVWMWRIAQAASVAALAGLCALLVARPADGLYLLWRVAVPLLPLVFLVAPGLWRNICPLAASNQFPRLARFTRALEPPPWLRRSGYVLAVVTFLAVVPTRRVLFDHSGTASAILLGSAMLAAFAGGVLYRGKSGWCSSICPLFPVQRLYGQTPFVTVPNSHCRPCVGCAKHCYDFNPRVAYQADLHDEDPRWTAPRKLFAGCFPGVVYGYFTLGGLPPARLYLAFAGYVLISAGSFFVLDALARIRSSRLAAVYGAVAFTSYYWFAAPGLGGVAHDRFGVAPGAVATPLRAAAFLIAAVWVGRTVRVERLFLRHAVQAEPARLPAETAGRLARGPAGSTAEAEITFQPQNRRVVAGTGSTLLEVAERGGLPIEAGCRMGLCGADPVTVLAGAGALSPCGEDETATLHRLGLTGPVRLACCARVGGPVTVSLDPRAAVPVTVSLDPRAAAATSPQTPARVRRPTGIDRIVVLGNGIAGVTAAEQIRHTDPDCEIHLVGREIHPLYNRMGISRIVYGRSAMAGLFLLADDWYERRGITCWLNTRAVGIDPAAREVTLGTGQRLRYDRLVLATGGRGNVPPVAGTHLPGCFVLREAADAAGIRAYVQEHRVATAAVVGAGPLGLEAAYALHELGLAVWLLSRGGWPLRQYVDRRCAALLCGYLAGRGIAVLTDTGVAAVQGPDRVRAVTLTDGRRVAVDLVLLCTGLVPNVELARGAGLAARRGVLVDPQMRTSAPGVYAAGDVAELDGRIPGLWPTAVAQATAAAHNAMGHQELARQVPVPMLLKGIGVDLASAGRITAGSADEVVVIHEPADRPGYARLVVAEGHLAGAVLFGMPRESPAVLAAVRAGARVPDVAALRAGDWHALGVPS
jgi:NADPH-dependent 2,4-dienoyl-CoA reductase/sulfur reductase-like enzyme/ferredoxin